MLRDEPEPAYDESDDGLLKILKEQLDAGNVPPKLRDELASLENGKDLASSQCQPQLDDARARI